MKALSVLGSAVCVLAAFAGQNAVAQTMTEADCKAVWEKSAVLTETFVTKTFNALTVSDGWCRFEKVLLVSGSDYGPRFDVDVLSFRGEGLAGLFDLSVPPTSLDVKLENWLISAQVEDPVLTYLFRVQAGDSGINADLSVAWDASTKVLSLRQFDVVFPGENTISATAQVKGIDLGSLAAAQTSAAGFAVTAFDGSITSNGLFESLLLMPLGSLLLLSDEPPEVQVEAMKAEVTAAINGLPEASFSTDSKAALTALVAQMPNPAGKLDVSMASEVGVGPVRLAGLLMVEELSSIDDLAPMFDGVTVEATFAPTLAE